MQQEMTTQMIVEISP